MKPHLNVDRHDIEIDLMKEKFAGDGGRVEAGRALAVISQPDVRVARLISVVPRHLQASVSRIQLRLGHSGRRQSRVVTGHCWAKHQIGI